MQYSSPQYVKNIESKVSEQLKKLKRTNLDLFIFIIDSNQEYLDNVLEIYKKALEDLIDKTVGSSELLRKIKNAYNDALAVRNAKIKQFITQHRVFGISAKQKKWDTIIKKFTKENDDLREANRQLRFQNTTLMRDMGKTKDEQFSDYLLLMRERDARYTLYFENVALHLKLKELDGTSRGCAVEDSHGDPVVLRIALDRCREQLSTTQTNLKRMMEEYAETVPRRDYEALESEHCELRDTVAAINTHHEALQTSYRRVVEEKRCTEEELRESQERCGELERSGTPRPRWEVCADFIGGGRDRWRQLAHGLSSRERLLVLLKELGPAAESEHLEYFDGLGTDPAVPPYLRHEGRVRNLRLSRREISVVITDMWLSKRAALHVPMQEYVTRYFEDRYQQESVRAEWAYNLCAGAAQLLDEPQARLWWGALTGGLAEDVYWGLRRQWAALRDACTPRSGETISLEEFEKLTRALFPLKSEVDIKNLNDTVKRQLKLKLNHTDIYLDKLFYENEEGFDRTDLARELYRQRQQAQDKYLRELAAELAGGRGRRPHAPRAVTVDSLKRAFAIIDPAIDHIRMERYIRWAFSDQTSDLGSINPLPLRTIITRLAAGDIERVGPRQKGARKIKTL